MEKTILIIALILAPCIATTQIQDIAEKVLRLEYDTHLTDEEREELLEFEKLVKYLRDFESKERKLNGRAFFGIGGNETDISNLFKITGGVNLKSGTYPYELELSSNIENIVKNGKFEENVSDIDISFDYNPDVGDGLWLENYAFLKRFSNAYLGIDQRYEAGGGVIFNFYSKKLTENGIKIQKELNRQPVYKKGEGNTLIKCYQDICEHIENSQKLTDDEIHELNHIQQNYRNANSKRYSKMRIGILVGVHYESEMAKAENMLMFNGEEMLMSRSFDATNIIRLELRPTFKFQPNDIFSFKLYPYFKFPIDFDMDVVEGDKGQRDVRRDVFLDLQSSMNMRVTKSVSISLRFRYFYDNAPKRVFITEENGNDVLLVGQRKHSNFTMTFNYGF